MRRALVLLALLLCATPAAAAVAVANADVADQGVSPRRLRDILLGRISTWADGAPVVIVLVDDEPSSAALAEVTGRELAHLLRGWKRLVYAGEGAMPVVAPSVQSALDEVRRRRGAMTVLAQEPADLTGLRVLRTAVVEGP